MKRTLLTIFLLTFFLNSYSQKTFDNQRTYNSFFNFKISAYVLYNGGGGISASFGSWKEIYMITKSFRVQPSFNLSVNAVFNHHNLGNRNRYLTNWQINTVLSPIFVFNLSNYKYTGIYEELNPFYFGNSSSVYCNYRNYFALGTNFVVMPRGIGRNITTFRNRTQQLIYVGIKTSLSKKDSIRGENTPNIQLNLYEDFFGTDNGIGQALADNFDRFYTGGGNLQIRLNQKYKFKYYNEIYTGNFSRDLFDTPDIYTSKPNDSKKLRYVSQEPGQKLFNLGRWISGLEYCLPNTNFNSTAEFYFGRQGGHKNMGVQNLIHSWMKIDKLNQEIVKKDTNFLYTSCKQNKELSKLLNIRKKDIVERLHYFYPSTEKARNIIGVGTQNNYYNN